MVDIPWFTFSNLKTNFYFSKVQNATSAQITYYDNIIIPEAINFVRRFTGFPWDSTTVPVDAKAVAMNFAVHKILADDENIKIAQARGQASFTVAGDTVNLDLSPGRNPFLTTDDEEILMFYRDQNQAGLHDICRAPAWFWSR